MPDPWADLPVGALAHAAETTGHTLGCTCYACDAARLRRQVADLVEERAVLVRQLTAIRAILDGAAR